MKFRSAGRFTTRVNAIGKAVREEVLRELRRGALRIENTAAESIMEQTPGGNPYPSRGRKGAIHRASPPGSPPNADTGELHANAKSAFSQEPIGRSKGIVSATTVNSADSMRVQTGTTAPYAGHLEFGTHKMEPRPFLGPAFREHAGPTEDRVRQAIRRGIRRGSR